MPGTIAVLMWVNVIVVFDVIKTFPCLTDRVVIPDRNRFSNTRPIVCRSEIIISVKNGFFVFICKTGLARGFK